MDRREFIRTMSAVWGASMLTEIPGLLAPRAALAAGADRAVDARAESGASPAPSGDATPSGAWLRGLEPMREERRLEAVERIEGTLPPELVGTLFRIGPGQNDVAGRAYAHWFDGDGMVCAFQFDGRCVSFQNRYVRTPWYKEELDAGAMRFQSFCTLAPGGAFANLIRTPKNPANTNAVVYADRLLALWEGGRPFALDPVTLETRGVEAFVGGLPSGAFFSAHPRIDPSTGVMYNFGLIPGAKPGLHLWRVRPDARAEAVSRIDLHHAYMVHDFGLTERHAIFLGGPFYLEPGRLVGWMLGQRPMMDCFAWHPEQPMRVYVVPRDQAGPARIYELEPGMVFHIANAFESGDELIVDACMYPDDSPLRILVDAYHGRVPRDPAGRLTRLRFGANGRYVREPLADVGIDFPRIDERQATRAHNSIYAVEFASDTFGSSRLVRITPGSSSHEAHDFGTGCFVGEPVFIPRPGGAPEDGWVTSLVYDANDHHSFLGVVPVREFGASDVRVHLPFHVPLGFHGNFWPGRQV